jgi:hypothetical protein
MQPVHVPSRRDLLRLLGYSGLAGLCLGTASCRRKDGLLVEVSEDLQKAGVVVRDWRRNGASSISVQLFSPTALPGNAWTFAVYGNDDRLLYVKNHLSGPRLRERDVAWLRFDGPFVDLLDRAHRVVVGIQLPTKTVIS